jgi:hypothetical protein
MRDAWPTRRTIVAAGRIASVGDLAALGRITLAVVCSIATVIASNTREWSALDHGVLPAQSAGATDLPDLSAEPLRPKPLRPKSSRQGRIGRRQRAERGRQRKRRRHQQFRP